MTYDPMQELFEEIARQEQQERVRQGLHPTEFREVAERTPEQVRALARRIIEEQND